MTDAELLTAIAATEIERLHRLAHLGDRDTAGPQVFPGVVDIVLPEHPRWNNGWWAGAIQTPAHPGRIGPPISPCCAVVHTADMLPSELGALVTAWQTRGSTPEEKACAHFMLGRTPADGVRQFVPVNRNGNHAGGPHHGVFVDATRRAYHPNTVAVGIEVFCAGGVIRIDGAWRLVENGRAHGEALPDCDVTPDPRRPGRGWHHVTAYQLEQLALLLADLELVLAPMPAGFVAMSPFETPPAWAVPKTARCVGHVSLDARDRSDPWPEMMAWLNAR